MRKFVLLTITLLLLFACSKNDLTEEFSCGSLSLSDDLKEYRDVLKKFRASIPQHWKTQLYFDDYQSQLYSADTTKGLTETYIIDIAWHQGELALDEFFDQKVKDTLAIKEQLSFVKSSLGRFKDRPAYWNLSKGKTGKHTVQFLQMYIKTAPDEYFTLSTKVFGDQLVDERICEAIAIYETLEFIE